jgi:uncharacterized protein YprB with RNaseH-like and TPR domain
MQRMSIETNALLCAVNQLLATAMDSLADRLSRVSALRPRAPLPGIGPRPGASSNSERLAQLLGGENRVNRFGCHFFLRSCFSQPAAGGPAPSKMGSRSLRLLAPACEDSAADLDRWLFLDTETTGLAGGTGTYAFLVGLGWWEQGSFIVEQFFMRDHSEEPSLLFGLLEHLSRKRVLFTFNGKSFDWPLLETRYQMARVGNLPPLKAHVDMLHPARQLWRLRLKSVALSELERHILRLERSHDIPSETIPRRYFEFIRGGSPEPIAAVFRHNQMDLCGLAALAWHVIRMLEDPESSGCAADELFGISRMLQRRGDDLFAGRIYEKALEKGLSGEAGQIAQRELARLARRRRDFELSNALWEKLLLNPAESARAYEQLAIYYERYARQPEKAAALSREALIRLRDEHSAGRIPLFKYVRWHARFQHRLTRLSSIRDSRFEIKRKPARSPRTSRIAEEFSISNF